MTDTNERIRSTLFTQAVRRLTGSPEEPPFYQPEVCEGAVVPILEERRSLHGKTSLHT